MSLSQSSLPESTDVVVIGAGAAGLMCALTAGQRGRRVLVLDHGKRPGRKILLSGGGRCNYTNMYTEAANYLSANQHYCKSALSRFSQWDFQALVDKHGIAWHEKTLGQLFCDNSSREILDMLLTECDLPTVSIHTKVDIQSVDTLDSGLFTIATSQGSVKTESLVIATGGLSFPTMGSTDLGYRIAKQFGHEIVPVRPALVPFTLDLKELKTFDGLSGISTDVVASCNGHSFREALLFTHKGLSGPSILQVSSYWQKGDEVEINWLPDVDVPQWLEEQKAARPKASLTTILCEHLPKRLASALAQLIGEEKEASQWRRESMQRMEQVLTAYCLKPSGTEGYKKAEVTIGGVNTNQLSSKTMASRQQDNLYFIGEVVDVTGHLGGFNFQWAWASGHCSGLFA
ncbi:BaiN/RdsA family NAD(P)/FAD-dependent oxidoreductase [Sansalvadorimonas verongulae]|uniref:NAD(P)/FAD-dependent oxidoreductase n=1 Tax=Sansalvadorimonas verongulae TaxID=2172824 RepID=UPI0012BD0278|nr:NAD(P)/FAD-dependent oxidoreductase [Sansalvadorimonas verongulae]MTI13038.1 NAD(P)/FAD-dependent oxidoreductase [Sansalvadorimonas verongulae]